MVNPVTDTLQRKPYVYTKASTKKTPCVMMEAESETTYI